MMEGDLPLRYSTPYIFTVCLAVKCCIDAVEQIHCIFEGELGYSDKVVVNRTFHVVTGLTPGVYYTFFVTAENAVSSQDININARTVNITVSTLLGG